MVNPISVDYYPNGVVAKYLKDQLIKNYIFERVELISNSFSEFIRAYDETDYDLLLGLLLPYYDHAFSSLEHYLYKIEGRRKIS